MKCFADLTRHPRECYNAIFSKVSECEVRIGLKAFLPRIQNREYPFPSPNMKPVNSPVFVQQPVPSCSLAVHEDIASGENN